MVPVLLMNYLVLPGAVAKGQAGLIALQLLFLAFAYFGLAMLPFRWQRRRLAEAITVAIN